MNGTHALRMKKLDDDLANFKQQGIEYLYMHISELSPTTKNTHAKRHGMLFTPQEVRDFWSIPENCENCYCSIAMIMVDKNGEPLMPEVVTRTRKTYEKMKARGYDWSD